MESNHKLFTFLSTMAIVITIAYTTEAIAMKQLNEDYPNTPNRYIYKSVNDIAEFFGMPKAFDKDRNAEWWKNNCKHWQEPAPPDKQSQNWYRVANYLFNISGKSLEQYKQMVRLYEGAARKGHYKAAKDLNILYQEGGFIFKGRFPPDRRKANAWLYYGLEQKWPGALEWLANVSDDKYRRIYLQQAADLGVALAQYQLGYIYENVYKKVAEYEALYLCAAEGGNGAAAKEYAVSKKIDGESNKYTADQNIEFLAESRKWYQQAIMNGGKKGIEASFTMGSSAGILWIARDAKGKNYDAFDPIRKKAYNEIHDALVLNQFLRFPRLNEVLPLPPAEVKEWKGIYSAMDPDDAAYYQNPTDPAILVEEVRKAGLLVSDEYIGQPVMRE